jgi:para-aminobenzoate N-oxygenase AurF
MDMQPDATLPEEERLRAERETYPELVARLSRLSVTKHYDAYADIPWDDAQYRIDPRDPTWELDQAHPLGGTAWYREQPSEMRSRIGLHYVVCSMHTGTYFENVLTRGLFEFALLLPNAAPEFRYAYHEAIEETQHSLMFREFVNRAGLEPGDPSALVRAGGRRVVRMARRFPELFFLFVLGGEDPIDYVQRSILRSGRPVHPLLRRMMQIHITEEARHLCFARAYLRERVPLLGRVRRWILGIAAPIVLGKMAQQMLYLNPVIARAYRIPSSVLAEAYGKNSAHRVEVRQSLEKVRALCQELDLVKGPALRVWRSRGIA